MVITLKTNEAKRTKLYVSSFPPNPTLNPPTLNVFINICAKFLNLRLNFHISIIFPFLSI